MKAVVLAGGSGTELKPLTDEVPKTLIKILGKPILEYSIKRLKNNGITDILIVTPKNQLPFKEYFSDGKRFGVNIVYVAQQLPGIEGAVLASKSFVNNENFIMMHGDIICADQIIPRTINAAEASGTNYSIAVTLQSDIRKYGVVSLDGEGFIKSIVKETDHSKSHYVIAGVFLLHSDIFTILEKSMNFNECFNELIQNGEKISSGIWNEIWIDVGRSWDIMKASRYLLDKLDDTIISSGAYIESNVDIKGPVIIESGVEILNGTIIKGPAYIGNNVFIGNNVLVRDHCEIGDNTKIGFQSEIRSSIIMYDVSIAGQAFIGDSIIGHNATIHSAVIMTNKHLPMKPIYTAIGDFPTTEVMVPQAKFGSIIGPRSHIGVRTTLLPGTIIDAGVIITPINAISGHISEK